MDSFNIGSFLQNEFIELMNKEKVKEFLIPSKLKSKVKGKCATCQKFKECFGCRFIAYSKNQDYYSSDAYCPYHFS